jgi:hypothetical protein
MLNTSHEFFVSFKLFWTCAQFEATLGITRFKCGIFSLFVIYFIILHIYHRLLGIMHAKHPSYYFHGNSFCSIVIKANVHQCL